MSYQVLARKWRPHTFEQVVGQQHVLTALTNALDQGRLHHAYLLSGTRGVGKTTIARILAKSLNCEQGISSHPCGVCDTCREIDQGNFVDLLEIDAASRTKVEDTRELLDNVQYRPARGRFKVYLIDEVHMLSRHSFNALLKTLEEPPPYVKFLLATTDPQKLPITILSRCLQFHLKSLDQTQIAKQLEWVLDQEGQPFEPRALLALAKAADGSMRDALSLTDQALAHGNGSVRLDSVLAMLGTLDHRHLHQLLEAILRQDAPATMAKITEIATLGPDFDQLHAELEGLLHRIAMAQLLPASVQEQGADADSLLQLAKAMSPEEVQLCYQIVLGGRKDLPWAPDGRTALEMTCLRMLAFSPRRDALHPASLTALPPSMTSNATPVASLPGKRPAAESATLAPISGAVPAVDVSLPAMTDDIGNPADSEEEAQAAELFSQQDELLREAAGMGYQPEPALLNAQPDVPAYSAAQSADDGEHAAAYADNSRGESLTAAFEPALEPTATPVVAAEPVSAVSSMQSLLGKRNMLRSRQRGQNAPAARAPRAVPVAPAKPVAPAAAPAVAQQPAPVSQPAGQGMAAMGHYDDLPPVDLYGDGYEPQGDNGEYEEYLNQGFAGQTQVMSHAPVTALAQPTDLPPWDLDGQPSYRPGERSAAAPAVTPAPATQPPVASTAVAAALVTQDEPPQPVMETIDWDELESDNEPQEGEATRLIPSSLLNGCGDAWAELIAHTQVGGRLRQLAINSVMTREGDKVLLTLKPEQRHLVSDKARADLAEIIGPALGQPVQVEVTLGVVPDKETPLEIEHRLYLGVREQVTRDLEQDPNVQFLVQRFGAVLHHESIEPLNR
ncbi:TPA: DNA polymerase III subunit gamma/tau [Aeromonas veronii]|uniref:DNA polymerase III subunit gamma/tau n=1 Tax=Aeromonas veronii TaxID=654 RepID=UPI00330ACF9C|nr:DNA polymerase III subunit gamma/tau [Aeromonas veronii]HDO1334103.1 DNA polymerase III subunit gamma/tau [Aeromonas veronii]HDO1339158.1 DNA polymerase III subunit gamma/tau [Aeromonas veronii]HDO1345196.1 DNA polymerase III subunit gamma/tau [Aeromonas veronii]HDO1349771.1 DNA polymerase III subunit gamma/tau [Aeromonas veronii]